MALALKQQQQELQEKRKRFDEDKRLFEEEHQRYMKELEDSMRFAPQYVPLWGGERGRERVGIVNYTLRLSVLQRSKDNKKHKRK